MPTQRDTSTVQWIESATGSRGPFHPRKYYERAAPTIAAMHAREGPFADARWNYIADDLVCLRRAVADYCGGRILDVGCGEGHWIDHYADRATAITLIDVSALLLIRALERARSKSTVAARALELDVFRNAGDVPFAGHDTIFVAFLLSHYSSQEAIGLLRRAAESMEVGARLLVLDSWHSPMRRLKRKRDSQRTIVDSGEAYSVRKRYVTQAGWRRIVRACGLRSEWQWWGKAFFACACDVKGATTRSS